MVEESVCIGDSGGMVEEAERSGRMAVATSVGGKPGERVKQVGRDCGGIDVAGSASGAGEQRGLERPRRRLGAVNKARGDDGMATRREREVRCAVVDDAVEDRACAVAGRERLASEGSVLLARNGGGKLDAVNAPTCSPSVQTSRVSHKRAATFQLSLGLLYCCFDRLCY